MENLKISIDVPMLIDLAKRKSGLCLGQMANELRVSASRLSEWKGKKSEPSAEQVSYLAIQAGLPVMQTLATLQPESVELWRKIASSIISENMQNAVAFSPTAQPTDTRSAPKPIKMRKRATSASANP